MYTVHASTLSTGPQVSLNIAEHYPQVYGPLSTGRFARRAQAHSKDQSTTSIAATAPSLGLARARFSASAETSLLRLSGKDRGVLRETYLFLPHLVMTSLRSHTAKIQTRKLKIKCSSQNVIARRGWLLLVHRIIS